MKPPVIAFLILFSIAGVVGNVRSQTIVWGNNTYGQTNVPPEATNIVVLAAGDRHCLALRKDGTVIAWGNNGLGQTNVPADLTNAIAIATGSTHSMALRNDGTISFWGRFYMGIGATPPTATNVVSLGMGAGPTHAVVLRADGTAVDWGDFNYSYTNMPPDAIDLVSVAGGSFSSFGLRADGRVVCWGNPSFNGLNIPASATNIVAIATGYAGVVALRADGSILTWGTLTPPPAAGFTNLLDVVCPFDNLFDTHNGILGLRSSGAVVEYLGTAIPRYPTNQIGVVGAGGLNALMAVGTGSPSFTGLPVNHTVPAGSRAYFRGVAVGQLPIFYQWTCNGTNMPGATNSVMVLTNVQPELGGTYYSLTASNSLGTTNFGPMFLRVNPLEIGMSPKSLTVVAGSNANFSASIVGQGPFTYQWQFAGTNLDGYTNNTLALTNVQLNQSGTYSLIASNAFGAVTNSDAMLNVVPLTVTIQPQNISVLAGTNFVLTTTVVGQGPFSYQWRFNGTNIDGATADTLTFPNATPAQAGFYSVIASNSFGAVTSSNAQLTVIPLQIVSQPQSQIGYAGLGAAFTVLASFQGPFTYQWQYMGVPIPGATDSQLLLTNLQFSQAGTYSVAVSNQFGGAQSANAVLDVRAVAAWGDNSYGETNVPANLTNVIAVAASYGLSLALTKEHTVVAWGLGDFTRTNVPSDLTNAIAIATGYSHCMALTPDGTVRVWGSYFDGVNYYPAVAPSDLSNAVAIAAGNYHALALRNDGTVCAWGYNAYGQTNVPPGLTNVVAISAGGYYSLALKKDGTVVGWGSQGWGETNFPPGLSNVTAISAGVFHGLALKVDGTVVGWGNNGLSVIVPPPDLTNVVTISGGSSYSAALLKNGSVFAWGNGPINAPVNLTTARAVAAGDIHALALPGVLVTTQMASASWQGGNFTVSLPTLSGKVYVLEYKDALTDSDWKSFPLVAGNGEILNLKDPTAQSSQRFYRVRQW